MAEELRKVEDMTFREMLTELEQTVRQLEGDQLELEESLKCYERGVELLRASRARLDEAQQKVETLLGQIEPVADETIDTQLS